MKTLFLLGALLVTHAAAQTPVVVELFTSEGCSSCPPADQLLSEIDQRQPIAGSHVIVLSEHVDYWNRLGWADPYSSAQFSERQRLYGDALHADDIYTPQAVVDGQIETVGNNSPKLLAAIQRASKETKAALSLKATRSGDTIHVELAATGPVRKGTQVYWAIAENQVESRVSAGENGGRMLKHTAVVRRLTRGGKLSADGVLTADLNANGEWGKNGLRVVAFLSEHDAGKITGAAAVAVQ